MNKLAKHKHIHSAATRSAKGPRSLLPTLVAVGGGLTGSSALALELGDVKVNSTLGQPLRASIAFALAPNEQIFDSCVALLPNRSNDGIPTITRARIRVGDGMITLAGNTSIREPMLKMRLSVDCAYTAHLTREYMLFVDPAGTAAEPAPVATAARDDRAPADASATVRLPAGTRQSARTRTPVDASKSYRVQRGDSLSMIADRIENRPVGLWDAVEAIFDANPDAFINNDPNLLKAGSLLVIPDFGQAEAVTVADRSSTSAVAADAGADPATFTSDAATVGSESMPAADPLASNSRAAVEPAATTLDDTATATISIDPDSPFVSGIDEPTVDAPVIPDTDMEMPASSSSPNVPTAVIRTPVAETSSGNWLFWLVGSGVALIVALLLFGRRSGTRLRSAPVGAAVPMPARRQTDIDPTAEHPAAHMDFDVVADESPTEENLSLDANLAIGTGLTGGEIDIAQDFGFAATTDLDLELPEEQPAAEVTATDLIGPMHSGEKTILDSEMLPDDEDYDMSVIMDATKMPSATAITEKDLTAIPVETSDVELIADDYTVSEDVDYELLEQDYEDELTATQALNQEIAKAAEELAQRLNKDPSDITDELRLATVTELGAAAQKSKDGGDTEESPTAKLMTEDKTVEMPGRDDDKTVEMPGRDDEATVEMDVESGKVDSKAG